MPILRIGSITRHLRLLLRTTSHTRLRAHDHYTSSTLIGAKGGHGCDILIHGWAWRAWFMGWFMLNMEGEYDFEVEYPTKELVQLVQDGEHVIIFMEVDP